jgi:hypothetical protein
MRTRPDDAEPGVQFVVVSEGPQPEEDLIDRPDGRLLRSPARRRAAVVIAVLLVGGGLAARAATSHDQVPTAQPLESTVSAPTRLPQPDVGGLNTDFQMAPAAEPVNPLCPTTPVDCLVNSELPPAFLAAVREHLQVALPLEQDEVVIGAGQLWYRLLRAAGAGKTTIEVRVSTASGSITSLATVEQGPAGQIATVVHPTGTSGLQVSVRITGSAHWQPPLVAMEALAADPRLIERPASG